MRHFHIAVQISPSLWLVRFIDHDTQRSEVRTLTANEFVEMIGAEAQLGDPA
jgi:hypothetical protein